MPYPNLGGKVIAVTGGFGALGRATGEVLIAKGAKVALIDITKPPDIASNDSRLLLGSVDLRDPNAVSDACSKVVSSFGHLYGLVNLAGGFSWQKVNQESVAVWDQMYDVNLRTALVASTAAIPFLLERGGGRIVNVGAAAAKFASAGMGAYTAAKAGVERLTEAMSEELKDQGINVNAVLPSILDTPAKRLSMPTADHKRWVAPDDLAQVIAFLLSDESAAVTGALIPVKGKV